MLPPLLLGLVAARVDLSQVAGLFARARPAWWAAGLTSSLAIALVGALRWHGLMAAGWPQAPRLRTSLPDYWRSLAAGLLLPGSLGQDAYRALGMTRQGAALPVAMQRLLLEKLMALAACLLVAGATTAAHDTTGLLATLGPGLLLLAALLLALLWLVQVPPRWARRLAVPLPRRWRLPAIPRLQPHMKGPPQWPPWRATAGSLLLSIVLLVIAAVQAQCYFQALGVQVDWRFNLLAAPILFITMALPLSFGGLGVREAAHVAVYGALGVAGEAALAVSVLGLAGLALNWAIGALLWTRSRPWASSG